MLKQKSKQIFLVLLILLATLFCGCSTVNVMTVSNEDGSIDELVYVNLDAEKLMQAGYNLEQTKTQIMIKSKNEADELVRAYNIRLQGAILLNTDESEAKKLNSLLGGLEIIGNVWNENEYYIGLKFKNDDVYKFYYGITDEASPTAETEEHFFYTKVSYTGNSMYLRYSGLTQHLIDFYAENYPEFVTENSTELNYTYVSERRQHSNADSVVARDGKYYHTWTVNKGELDREINLYYNLANRGNCILVCLGISLALSAVLVTIGVIVDKKKKRNQDLEILPKN